MKSVGYSYFFKGSYKIARMFLASFLRHIFLVRKFAIAQKPLTYLNKKGEVDGHLAIYVKGKVFGFIPFLVDLNKNDDVIDFINECKWNEMEFDKEVDRIRAEREKRKNVECMNA